MEHTRRMYLIAQNIGQDILDLLLTIINYYKPNLIRSWSDRGFKNEAKQR